MNDPTPADWRAVESALERYFLAREKDPSTRVLDVCDGDPALVQRVEAALGQTPAFLVAPESEADGTRTLGDFTIQRCLGRGGMGTVYQAVQRSLGRQLAIKLIDAHNLASPGARQRFQREAQITAALDHPNIVPVFAVGEIEGQPFIAMKCLSGPALADLQVPQAPKRVAQIGVAIARALDAAHLQGVVHRDVKPQNVILDGDTPYVVDFGLARTRSDTSLTQAGNVPGTLRYLAPERLEGRTNVALDPRVDVYGVGAVLYELLAGRPPFDSSTPTTLLRAILTKEPASLNLPRADRDLGSIVARAMAKDPAKRFASAADLAADLERYLAGQPTLARPVGWLERRWRVVQRHKVAAAVTAAAILVGVALAGFAVHAAVRNAQDFARRLTSAEHMLAGGDLRGAEATLELLHRHARRDATCAALLQRARAELALDDLLVHIANRTLNVGQDTIDALRARLIIPALQEPRRRVAQVALVVASAHLDGASTALQRLAEVSTPTAPRRVVEVVRRWLVSWLPAAGSATFTDLPAAEDDLHADEAALAAIAMRLAGQPVADWLAEIAPFLQRQPSARLRLLEAIALRDRDQTAQAIRILVGLTHLPAPEPYVWRTLAGAYLRLGLQEEARLAISHVHDNVPATWYFRLQIALGEALAAGRLDDFSRTLDRVLREHPSTEVVRFAAEFRGRVDPSQNAAAVAELETLFAEQRHDAFGRDITLGALVSVASAGLPTPRGTTPTADEQDAHRAFVSVYGARIRDLRVGSAVAMAGTWVARSLCILEPSSNAAVGTSGRASAEVLRGLDLFARVVRDQPRFVFGVVEYAEALTRAAARLPPTLQASHGSTARFAVQTLLNDHVHGEVRLGLSEQRRAKVAAWHLARMFDDWADVHRWCSDLESMGGLRDDELAECRRDLAFAKATMDDPWRAR